MRGLGGEGLVGRIRMLNLSACIVQSLADDGEIHRSY